MAEVKLHRRSATTDGIVQTICLLTHPNLHNRHAKSFNDTIKRAHLHHRPNLSQQVYPLRIYAPYIWHVCSRMPNTFVQAPKEDAKKKKTSHTVSYLSRTHVVEVAVTNMAGGEDERGDDCVCSSTGRMWVESMCLYWDDENDDRIMRLWTFVVCLRFVHWYVISARASGA